MQSRYLVIVIFLLCAASVALILSCGPDGEDGTDGKNGADGEVIGADDTGADDDSVSADDSAHADDDDDDGEDDDLTEDDLPYADDCPDLASCVVDHCQSTPDADSYALLRCTLQNCKTDYETCFGPYGDQTCVRILKCIQACLPEDCQDTCVAEGTYDSMLQFADVGVCVEDNCPDALQDPLGHVGCFIGACADPVATCCGGSIMGCM